jgi:RND family efflux transporter MFP subunit
MLNSRSRSESVGVCVLVLACASCSPNVPKKVQAVGEKPARVAAVRAERLDIGRDLELAAEFRPFQEVDIHAKVAGYLKSIHVDVGDRVTQGQLIAVLEVPEFAEELAHAAASEKRSELDVVRAETEVTRAESAFNIRKLSYNRLLGVSKSRPNLIAQQEIDTAAAHYREAEAQLATARAALESTRQQVQVTTASTARVKTMMSYLRITAPFSGVVTKRYADAGAMIQAGTASQTQAMPVIRLSQIDRLRLVLPVPESIVARVKTGSPVDVRVESLGQVFHGKVSRFTGRLDSGTRTMETEVDLVNPGGVILPGMYGYASLVLDRQAHALVVPVQAVSGHNTTPTIFVVNSSQAIEQREVKIGLETPSLVEIKAGLSEGELVIIGNRVGVKTGKKVDPKIVAMSELAGGH